LCNVDVLKKFVIDRLQFPNQILLTAGAKFLNFCRKSRFLGDITTVRGFAKQ